MQCDQEMCNKAVENYPHALEFVPECCKTQKMRDKVVHRCFFVFDSIPDQYILRKWVVLLFLKAFL